jgi:hypothetical protein
MGETVTAWPKCSSTAPTLIKSKLFSTFININKCTFIRLHGTFFYKQVIIGGLKIIHHPRLITAWLTVRTSGTILWSWEWTPSVHKGIWTAAWLSFWKRTLLHCLVTLQCYINCKDYVPTNQKLQDNYDISWKETLSLSPGEELRKTSKGYLVRTSSSIPVFKMVSESLLLN